MKNSFFSGAIILTVCAIIGKVIGAFYRIPFVMIAGAEGVGLYQLVYPLYALLLTISTSGIPSAISKLLSENYAKNEYNLAKKYFKFSMLIIIGSSLICAIAIALFSGTIARLQGNDSAKLCYVAISPAVFFAGIVAGVRGYFQGKENMVPTAVSGIIEQVCKVLIGLLLAYLLRPYGIIMSTIGVLLGVVLSEALASLFLIVCLIISKRKNKNILYSDIVKIPNKKIIKNIFAISLPIAFGGLIMPLTLLIDSSLIVKILSKTYTAEYSTMLFGLQSGVVGSLVNLPVVASIAAQTVILPKLSKQKAQNDTQNSQKTIKNAFLFVMVISVPAAICYFIYSKQIIYLLYGNAFSAEQIEICSKLLKISCLNIIALSFAQVTAGILQGFGKVKTPVVTLLVGAVIKVVSVILLVSNPSINIYGAEISDIICYFVVSLLNFMVIQKLVPHTIMSEILKTAAISVEIFVVAYFTNKILLKLISSNMSLIVSGGITIIMYFISIFVIIKSQKHKTDELYLSVK